MQDLYRLFIGYRKAINRLSIDYGIGKRDFEVLCIGCILSENTRMKTFKAGDIVKNYKNMHHQHIYTSLKHLTMNRFIGKMNERKGIYCMTEKGRLVLKTFDKYIKQVRYI